MDLQRKYYHTGSDSLDITNDMINMMYKAEHRDITVKNIDKELSWWNALSLTEKKDLLLENGFKDDTNCVNTTVINLMWNRLHSEPKKSNHQPILNSCLQHAKELGKASLSERYDLIATSLMTLPLSVDELFVIIQVLLKNKERSTK